MLYMRPKSPANKQAWNIQSQYETNLIRSTAILNNSVRKLKRSYRGCRRLVCTAVCDVRRRMWWKNTYSRLVQSNSALVAMCTWTKIYVDNLHAVCERIAQFLKNRDRYIHLYKQLLYCFYCMLAVTNFRVACTNREVSTTATYSKHPWVSLCTLRPPKDVESTRNIR